MANLTLKTAIATYGHTKEIKDGTVAPRTFGFDFEEVPVIIQAFRRMVRSLAFDVSEMAITTYLCARDHGKRFTALPIFLMRGFHHGAILYNVESGIRTPKDLEGKRVGVSRGYTVTTGLWARSILQHEHGVDLSRITWVLSGDEHVAEYQPPPNVVPIDAGKKLEDMLVAGELVAAVNVQVDAPHVRPLIANPQEAGLAALRRGLYPINHTVVVKDETLAEHPEIAEDIFNVFVEAKRRYVERLRAGTVQEPTKNDQLFRRVMDVLSDPLPYGIAPNRGVLEELIARSAEQQIISRRFEVDELFEPSTRGLTG